MRFGLRRVRRRLIQDGVGNQVMHGGDTLVNRQRLFIIINRFAIAPLHGVGHADIGESRRAPRIELESLLESLNCVGGHVARRLRNAERKP